MPPAKLIGAAFALLLLQACDQDRLRFRAALSSPGGELPFGLELERGGEGGWTGFLVNGRERIRIPEASWDGEELLLDIDHYDSTVRARRSEDGTLRGEWRKRRSPESWTQMELSVVQGEHPRFPEPADRSEVGADGAGRIAGRWSVDFASEDLPAVAIFEQGEGGECLGTFLTSTGDYRYLAGVFAGGRLRLSCFDGAHAFLFHAELGADGLLRGDFWSRDTFHDTWTARRDEDAALADPFEQTRWLEGVAVGELRFPDLDGTVRSLGELAAGQPLLIVVFGSWCPNCHDETAYLVELDGRYRERGLRIVGLAFELTGDAERDAEQVRRYARRHGVTYPLLLAGTSSKDVATEQLGALDRVRSYPTTVFVARDGGVRWIHSGFSGPATGAAHEELRFEFEGRIEELLAEPAPETSRRTPSGSDAGGRSAQEDPP